MIPVVLSGGEGKRLWPVSTTDLPKQFAFLFNEPLQATTLRRLLPLGSPWTVTTRVLKTLTENLNQQLNIPNSQVLFEPCPRNTGPAIALICSHLAQKNLGQEIVGIFPADHLIQKPKVFLDACEFATKWAHQDKIVTLGIKPSYAATGYGYIEIKGQTEDQQAGFSIHLAQRFLEKPKREKAEEIWRSGFHYWNGGIFIFKVQTMLDALRKHMPTTYEAMTLLKPDLSNLSKIYDQVEPKSIDYGVMEKQDNIYCIPVEMDWSDVGSWDEVSRIKANDSARESQIFSEKTGNFVHPQGGKKYALIGVTDLIVVDSPNGILICKKGESEKTKSALEALSKG